MQPSLGGKAKVAVVCTLSPTPSNLEESNNTLLFATRAKNIPLFAQRNEVENDKTLLNDYRKKIKELEEQLEQEKTLLQQFQQRKEEVEDTGANREEMERLKRENNEKTEKVQLLDLHRIKLQEEIDHLKRYILSSGSIASRGVSSDNLLVPEPPANRSPVMERPRGGSVLQVKSAELKALDEISLLKERLALVMEVSAELAKACMPLESADIDRESCSANPEKFIARLKRITKTVATEEDVFLSDPFQDPLRKPNGGRHTNGGPHLANGNDSEAGVTLQEVQGLEHELEEKAVTIRELEEETHRQRELLQQFRDSNSSYSTKYFQLHEKKVYADKSGSSRR